AESRSGRPNGRRARGPRRRARRAQRARARGASADRAGPHEQRDRRAAVPECPDGRDPPCAHPAEAGCLDASRAGPLRARQRPARPLAMDIAVLALAGIATAFATGLGAVPVFLLGERAHAIRPLLWGATVGLMAVASVVGLLLPALDAGAAGTVAGGFAVGVVFLLVSRRALAKRDVHVGQLSGAGVRRSLLVFGVLLVHSLPEGFAIGTAFASDTEGLALFVFLAI